jgi:hypothetical protein
MLSSAHTNKCCCCTYHKCVCFNNPLYCWGFFSNQGHLLKTGTPSLLRCCSTLLPYLPCYRASILLCYPTVAAVVFTPQAIAAMRNHDGGAGVPYCFSSSSSSSSVSTISRTFVNHLNTSTYAYHELTSKPTSQCGAVSYEACARVLRWLRALT